MKYPILMIILCVKPLTISFFIHYIGFIFKQVKFFNDLHCQVTTHIKLWQYLFYSNFISLSRSVDLFYSNIICFLSFVFQFYQLKQFCWSPFSSAVDLDTAAVPGTPEERFQNTLAASCFSFALYKSALVLYLMSFFLSQIHKY